MIEKLFFVVVSATPLEGPLYLQALMPEPDDKLEPVLVNNSQASEDISLDESDQLDSSVTRMEADGVNDSEKKHEDPEMTFENPFLKPAKRAKPTIAHDS